MGSRIADWFSDAFGFLKPPALNVIDIIEIVILAVAIYQLLRWIKNTKAWMLLRGFAILLIFTLLAYLFEMNTILWIAERIFSIGITALVVVFQPELRKALEQLGNRNLIPNLPIFDSDKESKGLFSDRTMNEIIKACYEMGKVCTGALIVIQQNYPLTEYERTGITLDAAVSSQLLINIFEHNTPLHDGAVIIKEDRIVAATCYLPLSDNMELSKGLGTRHRAGVGMSEATDSMTVIVSEETGKVSVAYQGELERGVDAKRLKERLSELQNKSQETKKFVFWKGKMRHEKHADE